MKMKNHKYIFLSVLFVVLSLLVTFYTYITLHDYNLTAKNLRIKVDEVNKDVGRIKEGLEDYHKKSAILTKQIEDVKRKEEKFDEISHEKLENYHLEDVLNFKIHQGLPKAFTNEPNVTAIERIFPSAFYDRTQYNDPLNISILHLYLQDHFHRTIHENIVRYNGKIHKFYGLLNYMKRN